MSAFDISVFQKHINEENSEFSAKRESIVSMARLSEAAERFDDMCGFMKYLVNTLSENSESLSVEERNLLSVAYKNVIGQRRASWRTLQGERSENNDDKKLATYQTQIETELSAICKEILSLLEDKLIPKAQEEAQVFYLKMAADYHRYLAECVTDGGHADSAQEFYNKANEIAVQKLEATHPIRLGLALNYSVCLYEIKKEPKAACALAKKAFDDAISQLDKLDETDYKDSTLIMQLLRDNLTLWTQTTDDDGEDAQ